MKKFIKYLTLGISSLTVVGAVAPVAVTLSTTGKNTNNSAISLNDKFFKIQDNNGIWQNFNSYDEILNKLLSQTDVHIKNVIGEMAVNSSNYNQITNGSSLEDFNNKFVKRAYAGKDNVLYDDIDKAANSYIDNVKTYYRDKAGNIYSRKQDALSANKEYNKNNTMGVWYYKIHDNTLDKDFNINPLNQNDIDMFKKIALRNVFNAQSPFTLTYGSSLGSSTYTDINELFAFKNESGNAVDGTDMQIKTASKIMNVFAEAKKLLKYDMNVGFTYHDYAEAHSRGYYKFEGISSFNGSHWHFAWKPTDPAATGYKDVTFNYEMLIDGKVVDNYAVTDLNDTDFNSEAALFINRSLFNKVTEVTKNTMHNVLTDYNRSNGKEITQDVIYDFGSIYDITTPIKKSKIRVELSKKNVDKTYVYEFDKNNFFNQVKQNDEVGFVVKVTPKTAEVGAKKNEIIQKVADIILDNYIFPNEFLKKTLTKEDSAQVEILKKLAVDQATLLFNQFFKSINSNVSIGNGDRTSYVTADMMPYFEESNDVSYLYNGLKEAKDTTWWVNEFYKTNALNSLFPTINQKMGELMGKLSSDDIYINYNNIPVFKFKKDTSIKSEDDSLFAQIELLNKKINNKPAEALSLIKNVSNTISRPETYDIYTLNNNPANFTALQKQTDWTGLGNYDLNKNIPIADLNRFQHLLLTREDKPEMNANASGIYAAFNLYNKTANKIKNSSEYERAQVYQGDIDAESYGVEEALRLYTTNATYKNFMNNPLPVYYGEVRVKSGTFNPSLCGKSVITYVDEIKNISDDSIEPDVVPMVDLGNRTLPLSAIGNNTFDETSYEGSDASLESLKTNAVSILMNYIKEDETKIFYNNQIYKKSDIKTIYEFDITASEFTKYFSDPRYYFNNVNDAKAFFKQVLAKNSIESHKENK